MSALLILLAGALWGVALFVSGYFLTFFIPNKWIRAGIGVIALIGLFTLPMRDEVKGAEEFEALCKTGGTYQISPNSFGKKFNLKYSSTESKRLAGFIRPVEERNISYTDVATGDVVATAKAYSAGGGWLVRALGVNPMSGGTGSLLGRPQCYPPSNVEQELRLRAITNKIVN